MANCLLEPGSPDIKETDGGISGISLIHVPKVRPVRADPDGASSQFDFLKTEEERNIKLLMCLIEREVELSLQLARLKLRFYHKSGRHHSFL